MQAEGAIASQHMASIKTAAEKNVELVSSHHEIMQQLLFEQSEATAKLVNVTKNAYHTALMRGLWTVKWLGVVMALYPRYKYCELQFCYEKTLKRLDIGCPYFRSPYTYVSSNSGDFRGNSVDCSKLA